MLRRLLLALLLVLVASPAWAAVTCGTAVNNYNETALDTTVTTTGITVSGSNTYLICHAGARSGAITGVTSVTFNGDAMTEITGGVNSANTSALWGLANPDAGTLDAVATFNAAVGAGSMSLTCLPCTGVDQGTPLGTAASHADAVDPIEITVSSAAGELVVAGVTAAACSSALSSGDTAQSSVKTTSSGHCYALATAAGAASVVMDWTNYTGGAGWFAKGVPLKPAAETGTPARRRVQ